MNDLLGIVPARAGSQGIKGKNLQMVAGKPLFLHAADTLNEFCTQVVVATDDPTVASIARMWGYDVHIREPVDATQAVSQVAREVAAALLWRSPSVLLQPTVPPTIDIQHWVAAMRADNIDSAVAGTPAGHIMWGSTFDLIGQRRNRQTLPAWPMREIGLYYWDGGNIGAEPTLLVPIPGEAFDIDTPADLTAARARLERKTILIRYVADDTRGTGHIRRMLTVAEQLQHHHVVFQAADSDTVESGWNHDIMEAGWSTLGPAGLSIEGFPDLIITDTLDNDTRPAPYNIPWISFEDRGQATPDLTINALYGRNDWHQEHSGPDWAVLRPEFQHLPPYSPPAGGGRVLVMFGGTDPANLHAKTDQALAHASGVHTVTFVEPEWTRTVTKGKSTVDAKPAPVAELMHNHDLLITSAGRTVYEAAAVGIPAIVLAQNNREATHVHLGPRHGNIYMGLGRMVTVEDLRHTVEQTIADEDLRAELSATARRSVDGKGLARVVAEIEATLEGR